MVPNVRLGFHQVVVPRKQSSFMTVIVHSVHSIVCFMPKTRKPKPIPKTAAKPAPKPTPKGKHVQLMKMSGKVQKGPEQPMSTVRMRDVGCAVYHALGV